MSERREKARERAENRYKVDYKGVFLNTLVSIFSSVSATAVTSFLTSIPPSQLPFVATGIFVAQILPKLVIELHKSYFRSKYKSEGFYEGLVKDRKKAKSFERVVSLCEHATYY